MIRLFAGLVLVAALSACGGDAITQTSGIQSAAGTYVLETRNGVALPVRYLGTDDCFFTLTADTMFLGADTSYAEHRYNRVSNPVCAPGGQVNQTILFAGFYTRTASGVSIHYQTGDVIPATISGGKLQMTIDATVLAFRRLN